jgi:hypothetical protein
VNVKLLRAVQRAILAEPSRLDMEVPLSTNPWDVERMPTCGTVGCIAGWALVLDKGGRTRKEPKAVADTIIKKAADPYLRWSQLRPKALKVLRLSPEQGQRLFQVENWPHELWEKHDDAGPQTKKAAQVTAARIDRFIETRGEE